MADRPAPAVVVLGSVHMDLIASATRLPERGESVSGGTFAMAPGGKGANQACQLALAGVRTHMLARLGADGFGRRLLAALQAKGVDTSLVAIDADAPTGASTVMAVAGDYASIIAPGAAARLSAADVERARPVLAAADALVLQLELPVAVSDLAARMASALGRRVVLNASPAPETPAGLPRSLLEATSILIANALEAGRLLGRPVQVATAMSDTAALAEALGIATIVITFGAEGVAGYERDGFAFTPAYPAEVVDTVGAGDAFLGHFTAAYLAGMRLDGALRRGAAAGALAVSRRGAYDALPTRAEVEALLAASTEGVRP